MPAQILKNRPLRTSPARSRETRHSRVPALTYGQTGLHSDTQVSVSSHTSLLHPRKGAAAQGPKTDPQGTCPHAKVVRILHMETARSAARE